ncbi:hypothetical protein DFA_02280 [Cavenderia fasciculata]|uniref:Uncharacterized protein n=1 Tax=Cavenderia fasciculata TaxID=261658 RepID=F4PZ08_CACFS|nr:uncharacterized protein DFA_02280 [Cavenderia fasciculata]EGG19037.1 hypothetical protein DFA_02280 [Cavenderia fasciculata]|eukprot:XP_004366670.1 hypothetical protein DFA_02280 [Cavenderia fasciculata]
MSIKQQIDNNQLLPQLQQQQQQEEEVAEMIRERDFFTYHPLALIDDIKESVYDIIANETNNLDGYLSSHNVINQNQESASNIVKGTDRVWTMLNDNFKQNLDKFELFTLANIFNIPADLILPGENNPPNLFNSFNGGNNNNNNNNNGSHQTPRKEKQALDSELDNLRMKIQMIQQDTLEKNKQLKQIDQDIKNVSSWNSNMNIDKQSIENNTIQRINKINQKRKELEYNLNLTKSRVKDPSSKPDLRVNDDEKSPSSSSPQLISTSQLCNNVNSLTLDEYSRERNNLEKSRQTLNTIENQL